MASILSASADAAFLAAVGEDTNNNSAAKIEPTNQQSDQENTNWSGSEEAEIGFLEQNNNKIGETSTTTTNNNNTKSSNNKDTVHDIPPKKGRTQSATVGENDSTTATVASLTTSPETPSEFVKESVAIEQELVTIEEEEPTQLDDSEPNADGDDDDREGVNHPSVAAAVGGTAAADADAAVTTECGSGEDVAIPARPVKRARTAFFVFSDDRRATVQTQHPGEGVAVVARQLGLIWSAMTDEEKLPFQQQAAIERERVAAATEAWKQQQQELTGKDMSELLGQGDATDAAAAAAQTLIYPVARIRKICKLDPEVRGLSKEALLLIVKSAELVTAKLSLECVQMATIQNRRKLLPDDVAQVCATREQFAFLREDIVDLTRAQQKDAAAAAAAASSKTVGGGAAPATGTSKRSIAASKTKPLTDFFKPASS